MSTRNKYICREIPQPDFVASFDGDMVVGHLKDATFIPGEDGQDGQDGTPGTNGQEVTLQTTATHIQWRLGTGEWQNLVALTELMGTDGQPGTDGQEVTLQTTATHIQWRLGAGEWQNLIALSELVPTEYPAKNVKVDEAPVPDYTPVALNDNLQQVTNKVAGLQSKLVVDITLTADVTEINTSVDVDGKALALVGQYRMVLDVEYITALGAAAERNPYLQINGLGGSVYRYSTVLNKLWQVQGVANKNRNFADYMLNIKDGIFSANGFSIGWTSTSQTSVWGYNVKIESVISALNSIRIYQSGDLMKAGSTLKIYQL